MNLKKKKFNLMYCSNIFKVKKLRDLIKSLTIYTEIIKEKKVALSLCLSNALAIEMEKKKSINFFKKWLKKKNATLYSINGFVYKNFHKKNIKSNIHYPDWTSNLRFNYTKKLIKILNRFLPKCKTGSISSSPISYDGWINYKYKDYVFFKSAKNISKILLHLMNIKKKIIHLDIEPEPSCLINNFKMFIIFFKKWLIPFARKYLYNLKKISGRKSDFLIKKYIRLCYDISHFSVNFENHGKILQILKKEKIKIGKVQISSALEINVFKNIKIKENIIKNLAKISISPFLHQTVEKNKKTIRIYNDLPNISNIFFKNTNSILRIHCHVPIYKTQYKNIKTTINETRKVLKMLIKTKNIKHFEIESYTYINIIKKDAFDSIAKEYKCIKTFMENYDIN